MSASPTIGYYSYGVRLSFRCQVSLLRFSGARYHVSVNGLRLKEWPNSSGFRSRAYLDTVTKSQDGNPVAKNIFSPEVLMAAEALLPEGLGI